MTYDLCKSESSCCWYKVRINFTGVTETGSNVSDITKAPQHWVGPLSNYSNMAEFNSSRFRSLWSTFFFWQLAEVPRRLEMCLSAWETKCTQKIVSSAGVSLISVFVFPPYSDTQTKKTPTQTWHLQTALDLNLWPPCWESLLSTTRASSVLPGLWGREPAGGEETCSGHEKQNDKSKK